MGRWSLCGLVVGLLLALAVALASPASGDEVVPYYEAAVKAGSELDKLVRLKRDPQVRGDTGAMLAVTEKFLYAVRNFLLAAEGVSIADPDEAKAFDIVVKKTENAHEAMLNTLFMIFGMGIDKLEKLTINWHAASVLLKKGIGMMKKAEGRREMRQKRLGELSAIPTGSSSQRSVVGKTIRLADGVDMPTVGFGTWHYDPEQTYRIAKLALAAGYRHFDSAQAYGNEEALGRALKESGIPRQDLFIATKLSPQAQNFRQQIEKQLRDLQTDYIDVYMLHSPFGDEALQLEAWRVMEAMQQEGKIRALGVSNFSISDLRTLLNKARTPPVYNQIKYSVFDQGGYFHTGEDILDFCKRNKIEVVAYSTLNPNISKMSILDDPHVVSISKKYGRSPAQVLLRWVVQKGMAVIPRSSNVERMKENMDIFSFELENEDMYLLSSMVWFIAHMQHAPQRRSPDVHGVHLGKHYSLEGFSRLMEQRQQDTAKVTAALREQDQRRQAEAQKAAIASTKIDL